MTTTGALTPQQISVLAYQAGFRGDDIFTMSAIVLAESGGDPNAHNDTPLTGDNSYGLAQINLLAHSLSKFGLTRPDQLFDPLTNLKAAYTVSGGGQTFQPWSVYKSGAYREHLDDIPKPTDVLDPSSWGNPIDDVAGAVAGAFGAAVEPFVKGLKRLTIIGVAIVGGTALVVAGAWRSTKASSS